VIVFSVDPGHTTGTVLANVSGKEVQVLGTAALPLSSNIHIPPHAKELVIEELPEVGSSAEHRPVHQKLLSEATLRRLPIFEYKPSEWKFMRKRFESLPAVSGLETQHERDALMMLLAHVTRKEGGVHVR